MERADMRLTKKFIGACLIASALALPLATTGCGAEHRGYYNDPLLPWSTSLGQQRSRFLQSVDGGNPSRSAPRFPPPEQGWPETVLGVATPAWSL